MVKSHLDSRLLETPVADQMCLWVFFKNFFFYKIQCKNVQIKHHTAKLTAYPVYTAHLTSTQ